MFLLRSYHDYIWLKNRIIHFAEIMWRVCGQVFKYLYASSHGLKFLGNNYFNDPGQGTKIQIKCCQNTKICST